jgi:hypothetical protein
MIWLSSWSGCQHGLATDDGDGGPGWTWRFKGFHKERGGQSFHGLQDGGKTLNRGLEWERPQLRSGVVRLVWGVDDAEVNREGQGRRP